MSWSHLYIFLAAQHSFNLISSLYQSGHVHFSLMRLYDVYDSLCDMLCVHIYMCIRNTCTRIQYHGKLKRQNKIWWMKENKKRWKIYKYIRIHNDKPKTGTYYPETCKVKNINFYFNNYAIYIDQTWDKLNRTPVSMQIDFLHLSIKCFFLFHI